MKKALRILGLLVFLVLAYLVVLDLYPKNANRFPFLAILFLGDLYLWKSIQHWISTRKRFFRYLLSVAYWLPFLFLVGITAYFLIIREDSWESPVKLYLLGFIFIAYASKIIPILFLAFADFIRGIRFIHFKAAKIKSIEKSTQPGKKITRSQFLQKSGLITGGILFGGLFTGMLKWVYDFKVHHLIIPLPKLPRNFDGMKIIQLSDIHLGGWASKTALEEAVRRVNNLNPDIVFFTGDLVNYKTEEAFPFEDILSQLRAKHGIFATLGNHDYGDYTRWPSKEAKAQNMIDLYDFYKRLGWKLLNNQNELIDINGEQIAVVGVENWGAFGRFPKYGNVKDALAGAEHAPVKLLLSHDPSHWEEIIKKEYPDIDITFTGHTHGFQFGFEFKGIKWSPAQYIYKHWAGLYENQASSGIMQYLYVNRGLGTIRYPGRLGI